MSAASRAENDDAPPGDDSVRPFQLDRLDLRGRVARLDRTLDRILSQHRYPPSVCALIGEATLLAAMIGQAMKLRGRFTLQAQSERAPVSLIAADYFAPSAPNAPARMRAYASFDPNRTPDEIEEPAELLGANGRFAMIIDQGRHMAPYQGVTPLIPGGLSASAETYFAQSEQIATRFRLCVARAMTPGAATGWRAGGVMLQHLADFGESAAPEAASGGHGLMTPEDVAGDGDEGEAWRRANLLLDTVEDIELVGPLVTPEQLLWRLFHEEEPRVYPSAALTFGCTCSAAKVERLLFAYPSAELDEMAIDGRIVADCQFCGAQYVFARSAINPGEPAPRDDAEPAARREAGAKEPSA